LIHLNNIYLFVEILTQNTISNADPLQVINHEGVLNEELFYLRFLFDQTKNEK